jgi:superoxide dismutase, Cu-Zn family
MPRRNALAVVAVLALACRGQRGSSDGGPATEPDGVVTLRSSSGGTVGTLRLERTASAGVRMFGVVTGIPTGTHGIHVHAVGRCDAPAFESAGGHFNPGGRSHGLSNPAGPHAGDAPNIVADATGRADVDLVFPGASLRVGHAAGIWDADGSAVIIHAAADDQKTDPSGNSGARIACGVIQAISS